MMWWSNAHFSDGPGIAKDAPPATGLRLFGQTFAREWWSLVLLNVIFLAASLLLVTLPAALAAMMRVTTLMVQDEPSEPWRDFRETFATVFWRATFGGVLSAAVIATGGLAVKSYAQAATGSLFYVAPLVIALVVTALATVFAVAYFQIVANHRVPLGVTLRAAAIVVLLRPLPILLALVANGGLWLIHIAAYPSSILLAVTLNFSLGALILSFGTRRTAETALDHVLCTTITEHPGEPGI